MVKRGVEHIINDLIIDAAYINYLLTRQEWLNALKKQADMFIRLGDTGEYTSIFNAYKEAVYPYVVTLFKRYKDIDKQIKKHNMKKASRAWRTVITFIASVMLMKSTGAGLGHFLPEAYNNLEKILKQITEFFEYIIEERAKQRNSRSTDIILRALKEFERKRIRYEDILPFLWWMNIVMESDVLQNLFKFQYLVYLRKSKISSFAEDVESSLNMFKEHYVDYEYALYEIMKALLSRCVELRGQYINKLHNAILFIKYLRRSIPDKEKASWKWFVFDEILTYLAPLYIVELEKFAKMKKYSLDVYEFIKPRMGAYAGPASSLANLVILSPLFTQHSIEAKGEVVATPADVVIAIMKLIEKYKTNENFVVSLRDVAEEILAFWNRSDILRRFRKFCPAPSSAEEVSHMESLNVSIALLIHSGIDGIHITTMKKPLHKLPPRMIGYDSLFIRPQRLIPIIKKVVG